MNLATIPSDTNVLLLEHRSAGSHALYDDLLTDPGWSTRERRDEYLQSAAVSAPGSVWPLAIQRPMAGTSDSVTPLHVLDTGATQYIASEIPSQLERARRAIALLDQWLADDSGYDEETWPHLKEALDRDRLSSRRLFNA